MKFNFTTLLQTKGRHGKLFDFAKHPETIIETPLLLLTTKGGSVPHLTREVLDILCRGERHLMQFPLTSTVLSYEAIKEFEKGITEFSGLKGHLSYCTTQDPLTVMPTGYNQEALISLWTRTGRRTITADKYMEVMEAFQPDIYEVIANSDTNAESSQKKISKTIKSSILLFQRSTDCHNKSEVLKKAGVVGVVVGGYDIEQRKIHAKFMSKEEVDGFSIEGFHNNGPDVEHMDQEKPIAVIEETFKILPEEKFRILHGSWRPEQVLKFVHLGVDVFDSSLPFFLTESFCAFSFKWKQIPMDFEESSSKIEYKICLKEETFKEDFRPLMENCDCHSCQKHTRAYIYHLIQNKELLASILLMLHNLHHYIEFFKAIRHALQCNEKIILKTGT